MKDVQVATNIYFDLTKAFNATQPVVALASGQAVVYYRVAIMSKDGDWVIRETPEACATVLKELETRGAHCRAGAPLDVRWLSGGWSSHFEFTDDRQRRVRCDFVSRPPRVSLSAVHRFFADTYRPSGLNIVDLDSLIAIGLQQADRRRMAIYEAAARPYIEECRAARINALPLRLAHARMLEIAERCLPVAPVHGASSADAQ
jgi:hypothetical protein